MSEETVRVSQAEFDQLLEYNSSYPTGTTIGKRWKRQVGNGYHLCEFVEHEDPRLVGIKYAKLLVNEFATKPMLDPPLGHVPGEKP